MVPEILPGVAGIAFTVTAKVEAALVPHEFVAVTDIFPLVALDVVEMVLVVDEPLHPEGSVQLYDVAVGSFVTA